jgi:hypothetical protein
VPILATQVHLDFWSWFCWRQLQEQAAHTPSRLPKKIHNWKSISSNYIGRIMHFCDLAKRVYKRVLCAFLGGGHEHGKKVAYICQITREESKGKVIALVDQPKCERSFSSWNIMRWWIVCILELHDQPPLTPSQSVVTTPEDLERIPIMGLREIHSFSCCDCCCNIATAAAGS